MLDKLIVALMVAALAVMVGASAPDLVLAAGANDQCGYRCRVLREECVADAKAASRPEDGCWDTFAACRADCEGGTQPADPASGPDTVVLAPQVINVGKWAEGIAFDGTWLWVAESGQRTIGRIDLQSGRLADRVRVGRLPVGMVSNGDGTVYALVHTDQLVWRQSGNRGSAMVRIGTCPEAIAITDRHLWVLKLPACSSQSSQVLGIELGSGRQAQTQVLGEWGQALTVHGDKLWVAHARAPAITVVDQNSLGAWTLDVPGASLWSITANQGHVYGGGRVGDNNQDGLVVMFDPASQRELGRIQLSQRIAEIVADESHVVAVGGEGTIWVLSARDLQLQRTITLSTGSFDPRGALLVGDTLFLTASTFSGDQGAVFGVRDWRPAAVRQPDRPVTPAADCSQIANTTDRAVCDSRELTALDEEMNSQLVLAIINTTSEAVGGTLDDAVALFKEQRVWLVQRDRCGADAGCLRAEYQARLQYMRTLNQPE